MPPAICYLLSHYISHETAGLALRDCLQSSRFRIVDRPSDADLVIIHNEPWSYPGYYRAFPELREKYVVGYAVWETDRLPPHHAFALGLVDEIWTCSTFCREVMAGACRRITTIPHVVQPLPIDPQAEVRLRERLGYNEDLFYFYTITNAANPRKNLAGLAGAFAAAGLADRARLVIKTITPLPRDIGDTPGLVTLDGRADATEIGALHRLCQCFVSAHRGEGWGLGLSEAMACGNLAVATAWGGNMEFMNEANSLLVPYRLAAVADEDVWWQQGLLSADMRWAHVDVEALAGTMARCLQDWPALRALARRGRHDMRRFAPASVGRLVADRLAQILDETGIAGGRSRQGTGTA